MGPRALRVITAQHLGYLVGFAASNLELADYWERFMTLILLVVVVAFGLLYTGVVTEERRLQQLAKPRKR